MKQTILIGILVVVFLFPCTLSYAELSVDSTPLNASILQADHIVEAELLTYTANGIVGPFVIQPAGVYKFEVVSTLKGRTSTVIHVALPRLSLHYYNFSAFPIKYAGKFLLLLKKADGEFLPVDTTLPLIPLSNNIFAKQGAQDVQREIVRLMLASSVDPNIRRVNVYLLRDTVDSQITTALVSYLNDPDLRTRDAVLYCLATNQQVAAIPRIAELATILDRQGQGAESTKTLENFTTPEAVPYLKPLIITPNYLVRQESIRSLYNIADKSCIPYLILALRDPDPDQIIPVAADIALHRLIPVLGPAPTQSHDDYIKHRQESTKLIYDWWIDELNGKHTKPGNQTAAASSNDSQAQMYALLSSPIASVRRDAVSRLKKDANADSVPCLVLALQDPDETVSYSAYITLHRLVSTLGPAVNAEQFRSNKTSELQRIYSWWSVHLSPKPFQRPDTTGFIRVPDGK